MTPYAIKQSSISVAAIEEMTKMAPRRHRLEDWVVLRAAKRPGEDPSISFPFRETCENLLSTCPARHIGLRTGTNHRAFTYLKCEEADLPLVQEWIDTFDKGVVHRDLLALSFSLDFDRQNGDPAQPQTHVGQLRGRAKPYDRMPSADCHAAANELGSLLVEFLSRVAAYAPAEAVVAVPPSRSDKAYDLPRILAKDIALRWGRTDATDAVRTVKPRPQLKNLAVKEKLSALDGTVKVDPAMIGGRVILLVDDLYQSGISMNWVAMKILEAGATAVFGLAVEKTCRNDENRRPP